ncbi:sporulation protein [Parendozoicomonas haliclonae]|uniref:Sporulation-control protein spo0M n=1 Tax=Parendozoicomonas haliclonae TaxID=1960125 RepID=A0A1X7AMA5_9GAMM|nr:sporulation protein [Parendozoicomonas haliclonae]SMA49382.1 Sporulation-control protein spo0M [Parendozoicomonas haliclonae]
MFKKLLASVGIGAAKVDTILHTEHLLPGQTFQAEIVITGGNVDQDLSGLDLALMTRAKTETDDGERFVSHVIQQWRLSDQITLKAEEVIRLPFTGKLHNETPVTELPVTNNQCEVWLATGLNIDMALDASDRDPLYIYPNDAMKSCMAAMENAGYFMAKADVEKGHLKGGNFSSHSGIYQEIEFRPRSVSLFGVKEVELSFIPEAGQTHVLIELDRSFRGDSYASLTIPHTPEGLNHVPYQLEQLLR